MNEYVQSKIRSIVDFPKKGIIFRDITTACKDAKALKEIVEYLTEQFKNKGIDYVAAVESRGFIFGSALACNMGAGLILIRKPGKLPAEVVSQEYQLEYGTDKIEMHKDAIEKGKKVLLIDDLLATGGTINAACKLVKKVGGIPVACAFVIELEDLKGREKIDSDVEVVSMLKY
ncbi:adenine phosphoribosyltransferase [bacterium]|nr:adenine phosphoribosyltransferase [bacterium]